MRTSHLFVAAAVLGGLAPTPASAATTTHFNIRGTSAILDAGVSFPGSQPGCTVDTSISLTASTSVQHGNGGSTGAGATGFVQQFDNCAGTIAFGSIDAPLPTGFSTSAHGATLDATIIVTLNQFDQDFNFIGTVDVPLVASGLVFDEQQNQSFSSKSHTHFRSLGFSSVSDGSSQESPANVSGALSFGGQPVLFDPTAAVSGLFETSSQVSMFVTK